MRIGFVGLGRMGLPMSRNLARAGHDLQVYDVAPQAIDRAVADYGATPGASIAAVADSAEIIFVSVPGPDEDTAVMADIFGHARPGTLVVDTTTVTVALTRRFALQASSAGLAFLEAPVSGAQHGAIAGSLTVIAGGEPAIFDRAKPILDLIGTRVHLVGPSGAGMALKLINQAIYVGYMSVFAEGLAIGDAMGIDLEQMLDVLGSAAAGHPMMATRYPDILAGSPNGFGIDRGLLFLDLAADAFRQSGIPTPVLDAAHASLRHAEALGLAATDIIVARNDYLKTQR